MNIKNFLAIVLILLGVGLFIDTFNFYNFSYLISTWWPLLIIAFGIIHLTRKKDSIFIALIIIFIGILLQAENLDYFYFDFWDIILPSLLIIFGLSILFTSKRKKNLNFHKTNNSIDEINIIFGGQKKVITAKDFKELRTTVVFGALELDFSDSDFIENKAFLELDCVFAGIEITVPKNIKIETNGTPIFGGFDDKTKQNTDENSKTLYINYTVIFGGIELKN